MKRAYVNLERLDELSLVINSCERCRGLLGSVPHKDLYHENIERMVGN